MKAKILIIDDEKSIRITLEHFLSEIGHKVITAVDFYEAMAKLSEHVFDLIITDILLPGYTSGIDLLRKVRERNIHCPVVMITGAPNIKTAREALKLGAFDYIPKPINKESLLHVVKIALTQKLLSDEKERYRLRLEAIFNNIKEGIITIDSNYNISEINKAAKSICRLIVISNVKKIREFPSLCKGKCMEALRETITQRKPIEINRYECQQEDNPVKIVSLKTSPLFEGGEKFSGAMLVIRDETRINKLERDLNERNRFHHIVGQSKKMQKIYTLIEDLSDVHSTVLITGESGSGKELVAEALHYKGNRRDNPLVKVNCSALQENLLESELFGHIRGAFTGAVESKIGRFQKANGGTIFLDEIGDISKRIQLKLLRVLQEKEFERVGESIPLKVDVRVVAATNQDLLKKVRIGEFRHDLYYRLKVIEVNLPALRDNREDIPLLVDHFIEKFNKKFNKNIEGVSTDVTTIFMSCPWHGNVRELEHAVEHAFIICHENIITVDHLPANIRKTFAGKSLIQKNRTDDPEIVINTLEKCGWNKAKAARLLGVSRPTIYRKIKEFNSGMELR